MRLQSACASPGKSACSREAHTGVSSRPPASSRVIRVICWREAIWGSGRAATIRPPGPQRRDEIFGNLHQQTLDDDPVEKANIRRDRQAIAKDDAGIGDRRAGRALPRPRLQDSETARSTALRAPAARAAPSHSLIPFRFRALGGRWPAPAPRSSERRARAPEGSGRSAAAARSAAARDRQNDAARKFRAARFRAPAKD